MLDLLQVPGTYTCCDGVKLFCDMFSFKNGEYFASKIIVYCLVELFCDCVLSTTQGDNTSL